MALLYIGIGLLIGFLLWHRSVDNTEWRLSIIMDIVNGSNYPISLNLTRKGKSVPLPTGATVEWSVSDPAPGTIQADGSNATLTAGNVGDAGTVSAKVSFTGQDNLPHEITATSDTLTVKAGDPDGAAIEVGAELP